MEDINMKSNLSEKEHHILDNKMTQSAKSVAITYIFTIFLGWLGMHKFYLKDYKRGIAYLSMFVGGVFWGLLKWIAEPFQALSIINYTALIILIIVDLFRAPKLVNNYNNALEKSIIEEIKRE